MKDRCLCWRTQLERDMMVDGAGRCKHCERVILR